MGNNDRDLEIIWPSPSDDENSGADGEEDEGKLLGLAPLGTSDLDIRDWHATGGCKDTDYSSEEDELLEIAPTQTMNDAAKAAALSHSQFSDMVDPGALHGARFTRYDRQTYTHVDFFDQVPLAGPHSPILASIFQLADTDSFGDLPVSSPPSETPSPAPIQSAEAFELPQQSIEQLIAELERETPEKRSHVSGPPDLLARQPEAEAANSWASRELENILLASVAGDSGPAPTEHNTSQETVFSTHFPEYIVEEIKFEPQVPIPGDDLGDIRPIPPPNLAEVTEMVQLYEVEEPRTDGRLTEVGVIHCIHTEN